MNSLKSKDGYIWKKKSLASTVDNLNSYYSDLIFTDLRFIGILVFQSLKLPESKTSLPPCSQPNTVGTVLFSGGSGSMRSSSKSNSLWSSKSDSFAKIKSQTNWTFSVKDKKESYHSTYKTHSLCHQGWSSPRVFAEQLSQPEIVCDISCHCVWQSRALRTW